MESVEREIVKAEGTIGGFEWSFGFRPSSFGDLGVDRL
jgi:hypothetical protein